MYTFKKYHMYLHTTHPNKICTLFSERRMKKKDSPRIFPTMALAQSGVYPLLYEACAESCHQFPSLSCCSTKTLCQFSSGKGVKPVCIYHNFCKYLYTQLRCCPHKILLNRYTHYKLHTGNTITCYSLW